MESVRDRLGWIVENCRNPATGEAWDPSKLSEASGLSAAHIGMVLRGDIGEPRRPTLTKIARAAECEGIALALLVRVSAERRIKPLAPDVLAKALGLVLSPTAPSGCRGLLEPDTWRLRYDGRGEPVVVSERLVHELGHYAAVREGHGGRHPEASIDRVAMAIWLPRSAVLGALSRVGFDPERLLIELPGVSVPWVIVRAAWVAGRSVIVRVGAERWAYAPEGQHGTVVEGPWEREMAQAVLRTGRPQQDLFGGTARPLVVAGRAGVVILPGG